MVETTTKRFGNGAIKVLSKTDVNKFADEQGNYAKVFLKLAAQITRKMQNQFSDDRIEDFIKTRYATADNEARRKLYGQIENAVGISTKDLIATEAMKATTNALMLESAEWVKKLRDETLELYTANTLRAMSLGQGVDELLTQLTGMEGKRRDLAHLTARQQVSNYMAITGKIRAQNLGLTVGIWETSRDEAVRPSHRARNGKEFDLSKGLYSSQDDMHLLPGVDFNCRCVTLYKIPANS